MTLTTLIGLLAISAAPKQEPVQVTIETKICKVVESALALDSEVKIKPLNEKAANPNVLILQNFDEKKLLKNKGLKVMSSPIIRTLDAMKAEMTVSLKGDSEEIWKSTYTPIVRKDALLDMDIKLSFDHKDDPTKSWNVSTKPQMHPGQPIAYMVQTKGLTMLYIIKAHIGDGS